MSRRYPDFRCPAQAPWTWRDTVLVLVIAVVIFLLGFGLLLASLAIQWPGALS